VTRRTQAERSASTQARLIEATLECLVDLGIEGTSTKEICRRAGVSKGAQLHHYPTKLSLMVATVESLCDRRHAEFRQMVERETHEADRLDAGFDQLRRITASPTMVAWMELAVASRTDPVLGEQMRRLSLRLEDEVEVTFRQFFQIDPETPARAAVRLLLSTLDGLALRSMLQDEESARPALEVFRILVAPFLTGTPATR
jgi:AcrR family transcriptional regulator